MKHEQGAHGQREDHLFPGAVRHGHKHGQTASHERDQRGPVRLGGRHARPLVQTDDQGQGGRDHDAMDPAPDDARDAPAATNASGQDKGEGKGNNKKTGEGNDIYLPTEHGQADAGWICYLTAQK